MSTVHKKVQCWIFSRDIDGHTVCLLLKTNQARGRFWQPVTGTVEKGEGYFEGACRETSEETGFTFNTSPIDTGFEFDFRSRFGPARERVFGLYVDGSPTPRLDPNEHEDFQWVLPKDALDLVRYPSNRDGLIESHKLVIGEELIS